VLTFDDGPEPGKTDKIVAILAKHHIQATFFMVGEKAMQRPNLIALVKQSGNLIGNHSWDHHNFHKLSLSQQQEEITKSELILEHPLWFRYPYGNATCQSNQWLHQKGYSIAGWHVDSCDWAFEKTGVVSDKEAAICGVQLHHRHNFVEHIVSMVKKRNGGIVLMHDSRSNTVLHLDLLIKRLKQEGFVFGTLADGAFKAQMK